MPITDETKIKKQNLTLTDETKTLASDPPITDETKKIKVEGIPPNKSTGFIGTGSLGTYLGIVTAIGCGYPSGSGYFTFNSYANVQIPSGWSSSLNFWRD